MGEQTLRQRTTVTTTENDEIPEDVQEFKEKLEKETGKKYRYRTPKKDLPSVGDLLKHGHGEPATFMDDTGFFLFLMGLFFVTLYMFHIFVSPVW